MASTSTLPPIPEESPFPLQGPSTITLYIPRPDSINPTACDIDTFRPFYKNGSNKEVRQRRLDTFRLVFLELPQQTNLLTTALNNILKRTARIQWEENGKKLFDDIPVYSLQPKIFEKLMFSLYKARGAAQDSFQLQGKKTPQAPAWLGLGGNIGEEFMNANDFELLGIVLQGQVESFLDELAEFHNFKTGLPMGFDKLDKDFTLTVALVTGKREKTKEKGKEKTSKSYRQPRYDSISGDLRYQRSRQYGKGRHHSERHNSKEKSSRTSQSTARGTGSSHINQSERLRSLYDNGDLMSSGTETDTETETERKQGQHHRSADMSDPSESSSSEDERGGRRHREGSRGRDSRRNEDDHSHSSCLTTHINNQFVFDMKLKQEVVPTWDGDMDSIVCWIAKVNNIARYGKKVRKQLGSIVPRRLQGSAETRYFSLPKTTRLRLETDWKHLRHKMIKYYMNHKWLENIRCKARAACYRKTGHTQESPSEAHDGTYGESTALMVTILTTQAYDTAKELQNAIRYHESTLIWLEPETAKFNNTWFSSWDYERPFKPTYKPWTYLIGQCSNLPPPASPKDDSNVLKRATPKDKGARPCRHCGSELHWDQECKHSRKTARELYEELEKQDFEQALQTPEPMAVLEGDNTSNTDKETDVQTYQTRTQVQNMPNWRTQRELARRRSQATTFLSKQGTITAEARSVFELSKRVNRPPGCTFLDSGSEDSGSDITLISQSALNSLALEPRVKNGQRVKLIQVTGSSTISGFLTIDLYFHTKQGPVKINVDMYVVNGMSMPFILGNDFQDQYDLSVMRRDGRSFLKFGESERELEVENSISSKRTDKNGHVFRILVRIRLNKVEVHAKNRTIIPAESCKKVQVEARFPEGINYLYIERHIQMVQNEDQVHGSPDSLIMRADPCLLVSNFSRFPVVIAAGQSLGTSHNPATWLDKAHRMRPEDLKRAKMHVTLIQSLVKVNNESQTLAVHSETDISSKAHLNNSGLDDPTAEEPVEGGLKTAEVGLDEVSSEKLLSEVHISSEVTTEQQQQLEKVLKDNSSAFGLDGQLGEYPGKVEVPMKLGAQPVSLPPFPASSANREVMNKQIDSWLQLGVIEPSASPWGAPVFIVH
ncbi:hypothetical protein PQX77_021659 [Marasmius sp. AFHP31]|nr:hypothetical protein PQX77_021659 [Marasmius sp. AFHP31]